MGKQWKQWEALFWRAPKSLQVVISAMKLKDACSLEEKLWPTYYKGCNTAFYKQPITKQRHYSANKGPSSQGYGFSSSHVWMWELNHKESWALKNWFLWTVVLEKTLESPLDCKEIQIVHPKGDQSWVFIGRTNVEAETPVFWPHDAKSWLIWKDPDDGKDWRQEEKGTTEDEMVGWNHWLNIDISLSRLWEMVKDREACYAAEYEIAKSQTQLSDWQQQISYLRDEG